LQVKWAKDLDQLPLVDSNHHYRIQRPVSCHWTKGQRASRKLVQKLYRDNARRRARDDAFRARRYDQRGKFRRRFDPTRSYAGHFEHRRTSSTHSIEKAESISSRQECVDLRPPRSHDRLEIIDRVFCRRFPFGEHLGGQLGRFARHLAARIVEYLIGLCGFYPERREEKLDVSRRQRW